MLETELKISQPDATYAKLVAAFDGLEDQEVMKVAAKIILLLANHIGDETVVDEAVSASLGVYQMKPALK